MADPVPYIFISYARADLERVLTVVAELERAGVAVWMDEANIAGGANYGPEIVTAIHDASAVLVMCSAAGFASRNVRQEIALAWKYERPLIPLRLEPVEPPPELAYWLEASQWIDALALDSGTYVDGLFGALRRHGLEIQPTEQSQPSPETNLPAPVTEFLGRQNELFEVERLCAESRLVTLVGAGGSGKTRLAIEASRLNVGLEPNGVWMVELAAVAEPAYVLAAIATALGVRDQPGRTLEESLTAFLSPRHMLLVLDNCEHLIAECARVAERLLSRCPHLHLLATSREPLSIPGEAVYRVPTFRVPSENESNTVVAISTYESVQLFVKRAAVVQSEFTLTDDNAAAIANICRRLDGIPLAIELAAARIKLLTVEQVDERLQDRFHLLTGGSRTELPRHQTLNGLIAWSYDLLSDEERVLFEQVSLFRGGWTLETAETICTEVDPTHVLDLLTQLYDKSLILLDNDGAEPRFSQLETIRAFGRSRLVERGLEESLSERNARYFANLVAQAAPFLVRYGSPDEIHYRTRLAADYPNIRASLEWSTTHDQPELAIRTATSLMWYWLLRGEVREALTWLERTLRQCEECSHEAILGAKAALQAFLFQTGDYLGSIAVGEPLVDAFEAIGDEHHAAFVRYNVGASRLELGEYEKAEHLLTQAGTTFHALGDYVFEGFAHMERGARRYKRGEYDEARTLYDLAIDLITRSGEPLHAVWPRFDLALVAIATGDLETAANHLLEGAELVASGATIMAWAYVSAAATIAVTQERFTEAARLFGASQALTEKTGATFEKVVFNQSIETLRRKLPTADLDMAWTSGRSLGEERALRAAVELCQSVLADEEPRHGA